MSWEDLKAKRGDRISTKWNKLVALGDKSAISVGASTRVRSIPSGGVHVMGEPSKQKARHPWRLGYVDEEGFAVMREGSVGGQIPWVQPDLRLGEFDEEDDIARLVLKPKEEGFSFVAVGVNVAANSSPRAELTLEATWEQLRVAEIPELPPGLGSGGAVPDSVGWAWYPLVRVKWEDGLMVAQFQIVRHNLNHFVVKDKNNKARHFFPPSA